MKKRNKVLKDLSRWSVYEYVNIHKLKGSNGCGCGNGENSDPPGGGGPPESTIPPPIV